MGKGSHSLSTKACPQREHQKKNPPKTGKRSASDGDQRSRVKKGEVQSGVKGRLSYLGRKGEESAEGGLSVQSRQKDVGAKQIDRKKETFASKKVSHILEKKKKKNERGGKEMHVLSTRLHLCAEEKRIEKKPKHSNEKDGFKPLARRFRKDDSGRGGMAYGPTTAAGGHKEGTKRLPGAERIARLRSFIIFFGVREGRKCRRGRKDNASKKANGR